MTRCKNTSDRFRCTCVYRLQRETSNWKFLSAATSYARSPIVYTVHTQSFQSRFCSAWFFLYSGETCCCSSPLEKTMSGIRKKRLAGTLSCVRRPHVSTDLHTLFVRNKRHDRLAVTESSEERSSLESRAFSFDTSSELAERKKKLAVKTTRISRRRPLLLADDDRRLMS